MVVSTQWKNMNISQNGNLPQIGVKIKNIWNHHPVLVGAGHVRSRANLPRLMIDHFLFLIKRSKLGPWNPIESTPTRLQGGPSHHQRKKWSYTTTTASWWFQPLWKIFVKLGIFPNFRAENNNYLKPPTREGLTVPHKKKKNRTSDSKRDWQPRVKTMRFASENPGFAPFIPVRSFTSWRVYFSWLVNLPLCKVPPWEIKS